MPSASLPGSLPEGSLRARLRRVLGEASHDPSFDVPSLAARLGMSRAQLHRRVREEAGSTPAELIILFRLERAAEMLARRAGNVGEVAYAVGFKNLSHFVRRFRSSTARHPRPTRPRARRRRTGRSPVFSREPRPSDRLTETDGTRFETHGLPPFPRVRQHRHPMREPAK